MLKTLMSGLRRTGLFPAAKRDAIVLLNHNPANPSEPDDVSVFGSPAALVGDLRTVDLLENAYLAIDSNGRRITMTPTDPGDPDSRIKIAVASHGGEAQLALRLIKHYLLALVVEEALDLDRRTIEREHRMAKLIAMVPPRDISD